MLVGYGGLFGVLAACGGRAAFDSDQGSSDPAGASGASVSAGGSGTAGVVSGTAGGVSVDVGGKTGATGPASSADPPPTQSIPKGCSSRGSGNGSNCKLSVTCPARAYDEIHCSQAVDGSSACDCGGRFFILEASGDTACAIGIGKCAR